MYKPERQRSKNFHECCASLLNVCCHVNITYVHAFVSATHASILHVVILDGDVSESVCGGGELDGPRFTSLQVSFGFCDSLPTVKEERLAKDLRWNIIHTSLLFNNGTGLDVRRRCMDSVYTHIRTMLLCMLADYKHAIQARE